MDGGREHKAPGSAAGGTADLEGGGDRERMRMLGMRRRMIQRKAKQEQPDKKDEAAEGSAAEAEARGADHEGTAAEGEGTPAEGEPGMEKAEKPSRKGEEPYPVGTELWVKRSLMGMPYHHAGVYAGKGQVVHVSPSGKGMWEDTKQATHNLLHGKELASVLQTTVGEFAEGGPVTQGPSEHRFTPKERAKRAISHLSEQWHYRPLDHNCQHFSSEMVSGTPHSPEAETLAHKLGMKTAEDKAGAKAQKEQQKANKQFQKEVRASAPKTDGK
jgi:hypothetical protein